MTCCGFDADVRKGQPFQPDQRMKALLEEGVALGNATARALCFAPRDESVRVYSSFGVQFWFSIGLFMT